MRQSIRHRLAVALRWVERKSDNLARRLEPEAYRVWRVRPPAGVDPFAEAQISVKGRGDGTWIIAGGMRRQEAPLQD